MEIVKRRYRLLSDFSQVHGFLADIYTLDTLNSYYRRFSNTPIRIRSSTISLPIGSEYGRKRAKLSALRAMKWISGKAFL